MEIAIKLFRFLWRKRWYLIILPLIVCVIAIVVTKNDQKSYSTNSIIYTGILSGYDLGNTETSTSWVKSNTMMATYLNIIQSQTTLMNISIKLFAQHMTYGDTLKDTPYISQKNFKRIFYKTPNNIKKLVDRNSYEHTLSNFLKNRKEKYDNYLYGIYMWDYEYYGKKALKTISVERLGSSDMVEISYSTNDPYISYNTIDLLNEAFIIEYKKIRDDETYEAIKYFSTEKEKAHNKLLTAENNYRVFTTNNNIINYTAQSEYAARLNYDWNAEMNISSKALKAANRTISKLQNEFGDSFNSLSKNKDFVQNLQQISNLQSEKTLKYLTKHENNDEINNKLFISENQLKNQIQALLNYDNINSVLVKENYASQWLLSTIDREKALANLTVLKKIKKELDKTYSDFSPLNVEISQHLRKISLLEKEYISISDNLNQAKLKQKNTQMNSNVKIITPPQLPLQPEPSKRLLKVAGSTIATFIFLFGLFAILELLNKTLRDKDKTEFLTKGKVIAAYPTTPMRFHKNYLKEYQKNAIMILSNEIMSRTNSNEINIINFVSLIPTKEILPIIEYLAYYWTTIGRKSRIIDWKTSFERNDKQIMYPINYNDLLAIENDKLVLINHRDLKTDFIQKKIINKAILNIIVLDAQTSWKNSDEKLYHNFTNQTLDKNNTFIMLIDISKLTLEEFTGQLPPYNFFANLSHDIYNLGISSRNR
ncbi:MAG: Wzz/FepE/Etk N-terminal domain-containing protein [Bacteroidales bacterium]